jgi:hypothetical protein
MNKLDDIDFSQCRFVIEIDDGVRRGLIRFFTSWIEERLAAQGMPVTAGSVITADAVDAFAWKLSRDFLSDVARMIDDNSPDIFGGDAGEVVRDEISSSIEHFLAEVTAEGAESQTEIDLSPWVTFLDAAADTPLASI